MCCLNELKLHGRDRPILFIHTRNISAFCPREAIISAFLQWISAFSKLTLEKKETTWVGWWVVRSDMVQVLEQIVQSFFATLELYVQHEKL
jgi:hypothetical protein